MIDLYRGIVAMEESEDEDAGEEDADGDGIPDDMESDEMKREKRFAPVRSVLWADTAEARMWRSKRMIFNASLAVGGPGGRRRCPAGLEVRLRTANTRRLTQCPCGARSGVAHRKYTLPHAVSLRG